MFPVRSAKGCCNCIFTLKEVVYHNSNLCFVFSGVYTWFNGIASQVVGPRNEVRRMGDGGGGGGVG